MAKDQVLIELKIIQKGDKLSVVAKDTEKLSKAQDKQAKSGKRVAKTSEEVIKGQKGIHQTGLSSAKGFSKMNQMLNGGGGSSGLVAAYATLAANVFAATAAFNAFRQAAAFEQLAEGFTFMANESGRTMSLVVDRLKEVTSGALSTQEALQGASLAVSGGFSIETLEKLAKVARGASLALGRNLNDAFDRLTRGAIKLEPEILDELGIMVRLDDATEAYAATIGKTAQELTQFERQTAFINAINEQGIQKYGELADAIDVNPYDQLAASFGDLTKEFLSLINVALVPVIKFFTDSKLGLISIITLFGSTIITTMIPALGQMVQKSKEAAAAQLILAKQTKATTNMQIVNAMKVIGSEGKQTKTIKDMAKAVQARTGIKAQAAKTEKNLAAQLARAEAAFAKLAKKGDTERMAVKKARIAQINAEIAAVRTLAGAEAAQLTTGLALDKARVVAKTSMVVARNLELISSVGAGAGFKIAGKTFETLRKMMFGTGFAAMKAKKSMSLFSRVMVVAAGSAKAFGAAILTALPWLAALGVAIGAGVYLFKKFTADVHANQEGIKTLGIVTDSLTEKYNQLNKAINEGNLSLGQTRIRQYKMTAGIFQEMAGGINSIMAEINKGSEIALPVLLPENTGEYSSAIANRNANKAEKKRYNLALKNQKSLIKEGLAASKAAALEIANDTSVAGELAAKKLTKAFGADAVNEAGGLKAFIKDLTKGDALEALKTLQTAMSAAEDETSTTSTSIINLTKALSESEKNLSKFTKKAVKTTEFDDVVETFRGLKKEMDAISEDEDAGKVLAAIFKNAGKQARDFGITSETAADRVPKLLTAFTNIQAKARTLQDDLKAINAVTKKLGQIKATGGAAMTAFLNQNEKALTLQLDFNAAKMTEAQALEDSVGKTAMINSLEAERNQLMSQRKSDLEISLEAQATELSVQRDILNMNIKMEQVANSILKTELQLKNLREGRGSKLSALDEYELKVKGAKEALQAEKDKKDIADQTAFNTFAQTIESAKLLKAGNAEERAQYKEIFKQAYRKLLLDREANEQNVAAQQAILDLVTAQGTESENMITAATALLAILGTQADTLGGRFDLLSTQMQPFINQLKTLGTEGNLAGIAIEKLMIMSDLLVDFKDNVKLMSDEFTKVMNQDALDFLAKFGLDDPTKVATIIKSLEVMGAAIGAMGSIVAQEAEQRVAAVDRAIAQEKRLDGSSAASLKKIDNMEKKKEAIKRKAFERQKKLQIAETIMNTAASAMTAFTTFAAIPPLAIAMAGMITAIGLKQVSIIRSQQYEGGGSTPGKPSEISVGKRDNKVDVSRGATAGEAAYLRGNMGVGTNANNFTPGGAAGMKRGYAAGGEILVGERGPEVIRPTTDGYSVIPNDKLGGTSNVNFTINAVDAAGVQEVLMAQRGNIIGMIREAAHEHGEEFMEPVNVEAY